jgi:hypothetical protein
MVAYITVNRISLRATEAAERETQWQGSGKQQTSHNTENERSDE